jgi:hypothetical protein
MPPNDSITGGCLCGAVRYEADLPSLFCVHCHCRFCRRAHGAAYVTWFGVKEAGFRLTEGADALRWYASSKQSRRGFCAHCGTTLLFQSQVSPAEMHIALASADGPIDRAPTAHVFFDQRAAWLASGDDLPRLDSDSPHLAQYRNVGR